MESITGALGPLFLLILLGAAMGYGRWPSLDFWAQMERFIYFVLFPAMLVGTLATADVSQVPVGRLALALLGAMALFGLILWHFRAWLQLSPAAFTSVFQGAVRFNTYVGVAGAAALWIAAGRLERINLSRISLRHIPRAHPGAWRFVWSTNLSGSLNVGSKQVLILLIGAIGGETAAGGYRVASQLGQALVSLAQTVSKAIYPELVHAKETAHAMARRMANIALIAGVLAVLGTLFLGRPALALIAGPEFRVFWTMVILAIAGAIELVGASLESLLVSAGRAGTAFLIRAIPTVIGLSLLEVAMGWNGLKGAAFTVMGASALSVLGFWVAIISLSQITITVKPKPEVPPER